MPTLLLLVIFLCACAGTSPVVETVPKPQEGGAGPYLSLNCAATLLNSNRSVVVTTNALRHNPQGTKFSAQDTSASKPLEMCSVDRQLEILTRLRCDDGSNPFSDKDQAHQARLANVGASGRCGGVVDQYRVACPEKNYDIFMDSYVCKIEELSDDASAFSMLKVESADLPLPVNWSMLDSSADPFVATLVSTPKTGMTGAAILAIVTKKEAQQVLKDTLKMYSVSLTPTLSENAELQTLEFGDALRMSLLWLPAKPGNAKGRLFLALGESDNPHMNRLNLLAPDLLENLKPNSHKVADFFELLDGEEGGIEIEFRDGKKGQAPVSEDEVAVAASQINGHLSFHPAGWDVSSWKGGFTARKTIKGTQLRYIFGLSEGEHPDIQSLLRSHMGAISQGTLIAYRATEALGIHTVYEHSGSRIMLSSFDTPLGNVQCMLIGAIEEMSKAEYGHLFSTLVKSSWASAGVEAQ